MSEPKMRKANMSATDTAWFYRPKKGKYRRRSPVPATKAVWTRCASKDNLEHDHFPGNLGIIAVRVLSPSTIRPPLARYSHGIAVPGGHRLVITAGQLALLLTKASPQTAKGRPISASQTL
jgi:hypothetical protein